MHAGTGELVASAIVKAARQTGMPNGVFSNLNSSGIEVGVQLVSHPKVKAVGFTGSIQGGRALLDLAARREEPIPVFAEMGSVNPVVLLPGALKERGKSLASQYAGSVTLGTGQFCTNPGLLLGIKGEELDRFVQDLADAIVEIEPSIMLHPNIVGAYERNKQKAMSQEGLSVVAELTQDVPSNFARQAVTTVEGSTFLKNTTLHQEVFGPFTLVVQCEDISQLEKVVSQLEGQLTGTMIAGEGELSKNTRLIETLQNRVGRIIYNGVPTGVEVCPSMVHGGPYPASTDSRFTAVGTYSIRRWARPFSFQDWPDDLLPEELKNDNPLGIERKINNLNAREGI
jgi:NADP-dependent aldehyde dehydrogenase